MMMARLLLLLNAILLWMKRVRESVGAGEYDRQTQKGWCRLGQKPRRRD
jgi:hypothetical protein